MNAHPIGDNRKRGELTEQLSDLAVDPVGTERGSPDYSNLSLLDRVLAQTSNRSKRAAYVATALTAAIAWIWLVFLAAGVSSYTQAHLGPGMESLRPLFDLMVQLIGNSPVLLTILKFCTPQVANSSFLPVFFVTFSMWIAMSVAMMLPSAAPMFRTYADIAHVARDRGETTVPLSVLAIGYLIVWVVFALAATLAQLLLIALGTGENTSFPISGIVGGAILLLAGIYQLTPLKDACLEKCRNPFTTLFSQWTNEPTGIFKLGIQQGSFCVGCCWALMLVMLVVGTMNLAWMAFFTLFAIVEKSGKGKVTSQITGGILLVWGGFLMALSLN